MSCFSEINSNYKNNIEYLDSIKYVDILFSNLNLILRGAYNFLMMNEDNEWNIYWTDVIIYIYLVCVCRITYIIIYLGNGRRTRYN